MGIPSECKMPDLSGLDSSLKARLMVQALVGDPGVSQEVGLYRREFIRLVDKAEDEYQEARAAILAQIAEANRPAEEMAKHGRQIFMFQFTDHIETCINAVRRLFRLLERIKSEKESLEIPTELLELVEAKTNSIAHVRNAAQHMDERIEKGKRTSGEPIMLTLSKNEDGVVVLKHELKFEELAMVLKKMHEIAVHILTVKKMEAEDPVV